MGNLTITTPLSGLFVLGRLGLAIIKLCTKFTISTFAHCEDMKGDKKKTKIGVVWGLGVS